jgi:hypothetical protein
MVAFLTSWPASNHLLDSWHELLCISELMFLRPEGDALLSQRLKSLGLNAIEVKQAEPDFFLGLHRNCVRCDHRLACEADLCRQKSEKTRGHAYDWQDYCPNTATLKMLSSLIPAGRSAQ